MKKLSKKLTLATETVRTLSSDRLGAAVGGSFTNLPLTSVQGTVNTGNSIKGGTYTPSSSVV